MARPEEELRKELSGLLAANPFLPFHLRLVDGRELPVPSPDVIWLRSPAPFFAYCSNDGSIRVIRFEGIVSFDVVSPAA